ncbi:protochlorophyllide-dependent translocon component 52, chloroplastic-like [Tasmannia lanceolata]|uniref:protochlorophyllide-dependent translocon component 52, chloroplastic-like n=1 Tax=Tasmannia lanceolata TaxID=3420 RepID=UPI0040648B18
MQTQLGETALHLSVMHNQYEAVKCIVEKLCIINLINLPDINGITVLHLSAIGKLSDEHKIAESGPSNWQKACFVPTKSDALVVGFRKWLRKYAGDQVDWGNKFKAGLPPTPPEEQLMDRYWSHVVNCSSCRVAEKGLKAVEVSMQVMSIASIGIVAAMKQNVTSSLARSVVISMAVVCFMASKWLSHFIYKNFHFHDYYQGFR